MMWQLLPPDPLREPVVVRVFDDGKMESRTVSSFQEGDPDYAAIMALVEAGELTIAPAE